MRHVREFVSVPVNPTKCPDVGIRHHNDPMRHGFRKRQAVTARLRTRSLCDGMIVYGYDYPDPESSLRTTGAESD